MITQVGEANLAYGNVISEMAEKLAEVPESAEERAPVSSSPAGARVRCRSYLVVRL